MPVEGGFQRDAHRGLRQGRARDRWRGLRLRWRWRAGCLGVATVQGVELGLGEWQRALVDGSGRTMLTPAPFCLGEIPTLAGAVTHRIRRGAVGLAGNLGFAVC